MPRDFLRSNVNILLCSMITQNIAMSVKLSTLAHTKAHFLSKSKNFLLLERLNEDASHFQKFKVKSANWHFHDCKSHFTLTAAPYIHL